MTSNEVKYDAIILGAGISGLTLAYYLKHAGLDVLVLESSSEIGGYIRTTSENGFIYENGPNSCIQSNDEIVELLKDLDLEVEAANPSSNSRWVLKNGRWKNVPLNPLAFLTSNLFNWSDKWKVIREPSKELGISPDETVSDTVQRRFGPSVLDYGLRPFVSGVFAGNPDHLVTKYAFPAIYNAIADHGSLIKGMSNAKKERLLNQSKADRSTISVKGGLKSLIQALVKEIGLDQIKTGVTVQDILDEDGFYTVQADQKYTAKYVVSTFRSKNLVDLFSFVSKDLMQRYTQANYAHVIEVVAGFFNWKGIPLNAFGGLIPPKENKNILGVIFLSSLFKNRAPKTGALLTVFMGGTTHETIFNLGDNEIQNIVSRELMQLLDMESFDPDLLKIIRIEHAIPQYDKLTKGRVEAKSEIELKYPGIYLLSMLTDGIGIPDRIKAAKDLSKRIING